MNNKHFAVWAAGILILTFIALVAWYFLKGESPIPLPPGETATTTPSAAESRSIVDKGEYYEIEAIYPASTPLRASAGAAADAAAVSAMKSFEENTIEAFKENAGFASFTAEELERIREYGLKYAMNIEYKFYSSDKTISYVFSINQDTLGAHSNTYYRTFTFDRATGEAVYLENLFMPGAPYLDRLSARTRADLPVIMGRIADIPPEDVDRQNIESGTLPIADAFGNFAIDHDALLIIFPPYQVGPYVYGTITVPIPLADLRGILNVEYRP